MKMGSMFAGIGGFDLGAERAGFEVAWCIEVDRHAQSVLRRRFPNAVIHGDINEVDPRDLAKVDLVCGGFPCQDLSVAGKRKGLAGERSGLFHVAMQLVRRLSPQLLLLENVPGLLSSNRGHDFATVLREVGDGWPCAEVGWRVLDSRFFGVPQRRRRVFVAASARADGAASVLALAEGCGGNPPPRRAKVQGPAPSPEGGARAGGPWWDGSDTAASMTTRCHDQFMPDKGNFAAVVTPILYQSEVGTLNTCDARQVSSQMAGESKYIVEQRVYRKSRRAQSATDCETWVPDDSSNTLNSFDVGDTRATSLAVSSLGVRRLTPTECERLQGFPDGWTDGQVDSHRYRQLGNAVTVNVAEWLCRRAAAVLRGTSP
jgi:DNA (cytosine-5)-methyltransferase 1